MLEKQLFYLLIFTVLLSSCAPYNLRAVSVPVLQFSSGFEGTTHITGTVSTTTSQDGWIEGNDGLLGNWSALKIGNYSNLSWVHQAYGWFQGGRMEIVADSTDAANHVLRLRNTNAIGSASRSQWELNQVVFWNDDGLLNQFMQQFYRYRMYIPSDITRTVSYSNHAPWYMIWESHTWPQFAGGELTRHGIYLQKNGNSNVWYMNVIQERPEGCHYYEGPGPDCVAYWDNQENHNISVPFDQWFTFEVFFKYSSTDGEFYVSITRDGQPRQVIAHYLGQTQWDNKLHDQMIIKMYHDSAYLSTLSQTVQYYDDLEIWSDYPPGYFEPAPEPELCYEIIEKTSGLRRAPTMWEPSYSYAVQNQRFIVEAVLPNEDPPDALYPAPAVFGQIGENAYFAIEYRGHTYAQECQ